MSKPTQSSLRWSSKGNGNVIRSDGKMATQQNHVLDWDGHSLAWIMQDGKVWRGELRKPGHAQWAHIGDFESLRKAKTVMKMLALLEGFRGDDE